ncbi:MAG: hypothetical protein J0M12_15970 [Deltaproteobacteria bacterium]|nr:hypothetical protein [Deltaproteobacteria bacterium]
MIKRQRHKLVRCERGETMVSYVLIIALIALICVPMTRQVSWGVGATACDLYTGGPYPGHYDGESCWTSAGGEAQFEKFWPVSDGGFSFGIPLPPR